MLIRLNYGGYDHDLGEAEVQISKAASYNAGGQVHAVKHTWMIRGALMADTQEELATAVQALELAYGVDDRDIGLYYEDGTATPHVLRTVDTAGGTRVVSLEYPEAKGAEGATFRTYQIRVEGDVPSTDVNLLAYQESLSFRGTGGPRVIHHEPIDGPPIPDVTNTQTLYRATQRGSAIGHFSYPAANPPLWPGSPPLLSESVEITDETPKRAGPTGRPYFAEFRRNWVYSYESATPLLGEPLRWPS